MADETARAERVSRRERPAKPALTRKGIVDAALAILEKDGLGRVTMRRIAAALDTGPASLYVYVHDTEDLHAQILDALLEPVASATGSGTWRTRLIDVLTSYTAVLFRHPEIARMSLTTHPSGRNYLALLETLLGLLAQGGVPDRDAAWGVDLLLSFATVTAVEHGGGPVAGREPDDLSGLAVELATVDPSAYSNVARVGEELLSGAGEDRFRWGLNVLLNGVVSTPRTDSERN